MPHALRRFAHAADKTGHYEVALDRFAHYLALVETDPSTTVVSEMRATLTSNIGACLHQLSDLDGAVEYYERALQEFKAIPFTLYSRISLIWVIYGNVIDKRIECVCAEPHCRRASLRHHPLSARSCV